MKIRMLVDMSGSRNGRPWPGRGQVTEQIPTAEAAHLCAAGIAEPVTEPVTRSGPVQTAAAPPAQATGPSAAQKPVTPAAERRRGRPGPPRDADGDPVRE